MNNIFSNVNLNIDSLVKPSNLDRNKKYASNDNFKDRFEQGMRRAESNRRPEQNRDISDRKTKFKRDETSFNDDKVKVDNEKFEKDSKNVDDKNVDDKKVDDKKVDKTKDSTSDSEKILNKYDEETIEKVKEMVENLGYEMNEEELVEVLNMLSSFMELQNVDIDLEMNSELGQDIQGMLSKLELGEGEKNSGIKELISKPEIMDQLAKAVKPESAEKLSKFKNILKEIVNIDETDSQEVKDIKQNLAAMIEDITGESVESIEKNIILLEETAKEFDINTGDNENETASGMFFKGIMNSRLKGKNIQNLTRDERIGENIIEQIKDKMKITSIRDKNTIEMDLDPEHLGKLTLKIAVEKGLVNVKVQAESEKVKEALEAKMEELKASLEEKGLEIDNLSVSVDSGDGFGRHKNILEALSYSRNINKDKKEFRVMNEIEEIEEMIKNPYLNEDEFNSLV